MAGVTRTSGARTRSKQTEDADPAWYPEFLQPLGEPLEDPVVDGLVFTRRFRHADVYADLAARAGRVTFRS